MDWTSPRSKGSMYVRAARRYVPAQPSFRRRRCILRHGDQGVGRTQSVSQRQVSQSLLVANGAAAGNARTHATGVAPRRYL